MQIVNILLTVGLVLLISSITVLSLCAVIASSRNEESSEIKDRAPQNLTNKESI